MRTVECAIFYEFMKTLAGEVLYEARAYHAGGNHAGPIDQCSALPCCHKMKLIRWAAHLEQCWENPEYRGQDRTYEDVSVNGVRP